MNTWDKIIDDLYFLTLESKAKEKDCPFFDKKCNTCDCMGWVSKIHIPKTFSLPRDTDYADEIIDEINHFNYEFVQKGLHIIIDDPQEAGYCSRVKENR